MNQKILKNFVVFEGIDGAGTTTQIKRLKNSAIGEKIFATAEPTNGETGRFLRRVLSGEIEADAKTAAFLFAADRAEHLWGKEKADFNGAIQEKCERGTICVSDRYFFSSLAYQGETCGEDFVKMLNSTFPLPELLFFFEIDCEISLSRIGGREKREIYEKIDFLKKVQERYKNVISSFENSQMKIVCVDASKSVEEVGDLIWNEISKMPIFKAIV